MGENENFLSELRKRYVQILKTLYPNFENVISELWKRYIRTLKTLYPNFETLYPNFENFENVWTNEQKVDHSEWTEEKLPSVRVGNFS